MKNQKGSCLWAAAFYFCMVHMKWGRLQVHENSLQLYANSFIWFQTCQMFPNKKFWFSMFLRFSGKWKRVLKLLKKQLFVFSNWSSSLCWCLGFMQVDEDGYISKILNNVRVLKEDQESKNQSITQWTVCVFCVSRSWQGAIQAAMLESGDLCSSSFTRPLSRLHRWILPMLRCVAGCGLCPD